MAYKNSKKALYINPYTDFGFKKLFGEEANKDLLIDFLNLFLPDYHKVKDVQFLNPENIGEFSADRKAIFDLHCEAENGERIMVKIQKTTEKNFIEQTLFHAAFTIEAELKKHYWHFESAAIYFITILDFPRNQKQLGTKVWRATSFQDQFGETFFEKLHFHFLQMAAFNLQEADLKTHFDKWLYFLSNLESFAHIPQILNEPIFQKGFETAMIANLNEGDFTQYTKSHSEYLEMKATEGKI